jgi:TolB protein
MVREVWKVCPRCGNPLGDRSPPPIGDRPVRKGKGWLVVAITGFFLLVAGGYFVFGRQGFNLFSHQDTPLPPSSETVHASLESIEMQPVPSTIIPEPEVLEETVSLATPTLLASPAPTLPSEPVLTQYTTTIDAHLTEISQLTLAATIHASATQTILPSLTQAAQPTPTQLSTSSFPQGKIVFTCQIFRDSDRNQICLVQADGNGWVRLSSDHQADHMYPSFSPDGESIVFSLTKANDRQIYEMDLAGKQRQLTNLPFRAYAPAISPDNRKIVFTVNDDNQQSLWVMNRDGSNPVSLIPAMNGDAFDPVWSPDGSQILFAVTRAGSTQLFVINADGSNLRQLTSLSDLRGRSDWAPDGKTIATYSGPSWQREIILVGEDGSLLKQITNGGNNLAPNYSPDGGWIAFTSYRDNYRDNNGCEIYIMRADGSQVQRLTENSYCDWQPNWGP